MKIGFIGAGNMANAIISGIIGKKFVDSSDIYVTDNLKKKAFDLKDKFGINIVNCNMDIIIESDYIILAVKPCHYRDVIDEIRDLDLSSKVIISIAAGLKIENIEKMFKQSVSLIRTMPNTPASVNEGMTAICYNNNVSDIELDFTKKLFGTIGRIGIVEEKNMDAVVAVSGSSPAYVFMLIEAMADAAVLEGMTRDEAYKFAAQAVYGSAKMVLETKTHPAILKDMVCSPGGTTIEAVKVLEDKGFRGSIIEAMHVCAEKSRKL